MNALAGTEAEAGLSRETIEELFAGNVASGQLIEIDVPQRSR